MKLTARQQQVLDHLRRQIRTTGLPPTIHELMAAFGWSSPSGAAKHLQALAAKGVIALSPGKARGIRLLADDGQPWPSPGHPAHAGPFPGDRVDGLASGPAADAVGALPAGTDALRLPLVGRVAAGQPILAGGEIERHLLVDRWVFSPRPDFLLRVQGDSMIDDGILDGDLVAGRSSAEARHGQIVIARLDGAITIKRLWQRDGRLRLLPANTRHAPIDPDPHEDFAIEGIYCGLLRPPGQPLGPHRADTGGRP